MRRLLLLTALVLVVGADGLQAHEVRPAYLELRQTGLETYDVSFKVPARGELRLGLYVKLAENCQGAAPARRYQASGAFIERWFVNCKGGLAGGRVVIEGLSSTFTDVLVRVERSDGTEQVVRLIPSQPSFVVEAAPSATQVARTYLRLGVEHILFGIDHLLFVLTLLFLVEGWRRVLGTITAFTAAHSLTLAAATLGLVHVPQPPVEAAVALSIALVAAEIVYGRRGRPGLTQRRPWLVAFAFGLLHGLGFAGALRALGLPEQSIPLALLFFNVGVEAGQLVFVAAVVGTLSAFKSVAARPRESDIIAWRGGLEIAAAYTIGAVACFWMIERTYGFWA